MLRKKNPPLSKDNKRLIVSVQLCEKDYQLIALTPSSFYGVTYQVTALDNIFTGNSSEAFHVTYVLPDEYQGYFHSVTFIVDDEVSKVKIVTVTNFNETEAIEVS